MTEKLYEKDVYCRSFGTEAGECREDDGIWVRLHATAFYPEGGGQAGDTGFLEWRDKDGVIVRAAVTDTQEKDGDIWHRTDRLVPAGIAVTGTLNWEQRFDNMQNHSGEHLVSGLIHTAFGYDNAGFHMGHDFLTIDLSGELTPEDLAVIEEKANEAVWADLPCIIRVVSPEEAAKLTYRSKKEIEGDVRIVSFPGVDDCACCGTHVSSTGQIGLIRLLHTERFRGGSRVQILCGRRALAWDRLVGEQNHRVSVAFSAPPEKTGEAAEKHRQQAAETAERAARLERLFDAQLAASLEGKGNCLLFIGSRDPDSARRLANAVMETCGGVSAVFAPAEGGGFRYAVGESGGDVRAFIRSMNGSLGGRGGGRDHFAQGSVQADKAGVQAYFAGQEPPYLVIELEER